MFMTEWEPTMADVYKLMRELGNIKDSNAIVLYGENLVGSKPSKLMTFTKIM